MYDGKIVNFSQDHELNYILADVLGKRETKENREILKKIGVDYKKDKNTTTIYHKKDFYDYIKSHKSYNSLINK